MRLLSCPMQAACIGMHEQHGSMHCKPTGIIAIANTSAVHACLISYALYPAKRLWAMAAYSVLTMQAVGHDSRHFNACIVRVRHII